MDGPWYVLGFLNNDLPMVGLRSSHFASATPPPLYVQIARTPFTI